MHRKLLVVTAILAFLLVLTTLVGAQQNQTPFLGIGVDSSDEGALITSVVPDSPAEIAGLSEGDIITALNGSPVTSETLAEAVQALAVGETVTLSVLRDGATVEVQAELAARPEEPEVDVQVLPMLERPYLGVTLDENEDGVVIASVEPDSPAAEAGLQAGDVLVSINGETVADRRAAVEAIQTLEAGAVVSLEIQRDGETQTVDATLGSRPGGRMMPGRDALPLDIVMYNSDDEAWQVFGLSEDSALAEAGLQEGDVITAVDGEQYNPETLAEYLAGLGENAEAVLTVERDGETQEITVPASALQALTMFNMGEFGRAFPDMPFGFNMMPGSVRLGVEFQTLTPEIAEENNLSVMEGALITDVLEDSPASDAGIQIDDVVTAVSGDPVDAQRTLRERLFAYEPGETVTLEVLRGGEALSLDVTLGEVEFDHSMIPGDFFDMLPDEPARPTVPNV